MNSINIIRYKNDNILVFLKEPYINYNCELYNHSLYKSAMYYLGITSFVNRKILYNKNNINKFISVNTFSDFIKTILNGHKTKTFTYCFKNNGKLYLCQTYSSADDLKCKHQFLCNSLSNICAAGIIVFKDNESIFIDNLSGTYLPEKHNIMMLKESLMNSFGKHIDNKIHIIMPLSNINDKNKYCEHFKNSVDYEKYCTK